MTSPLFQQFLSLWSCTQTCHSPWDHYQRSKGELLVRKNVEIRKQVGDATWISWEAETNLVILVTFPGFLLFFSYRNFFRDALKTASTRGACELAAVKVALACLKACQRWICWIQTASTPPKNTSFHPTGLMRCFTSQFNPDQPLHHSLSLFQVLKSWYNGHPGPSTKIHQPTKRYFQFRSPPLRDLGRQRDLSSS